MYQQQLPLTTCLMLVCLCLTGLFCVGKASGVGGSGSITPDGVIPKLRALAKDKNIAGEQLWPLVYFLHFVITQEDYPRLP